MGTKNCFLLEHGDELRLSDAVTLVYLPTKLSKEASFSAIQQREKASFASRYLVTGRMLGEGGYGRVLVGVNQETQRQLACKVVAIGHLYDTLVVPHVSPPTGALDKCKKGSKQRWPAKVSSCFREFDILKDLSHPNVIALEKVFWSPNTIYLFQELITGGDLFSFLEYKGGRLSSLQSAGIIRQVLKGIDYLHARNVVHRDLKPDNILMTSLEDGARVVITDFGNARLLPNGISAYGSTADRYQRMFSYVGTLEFAAPEIHKANKTIPANAGYSKSVDMWSIGSVTATILTGDVIFTDRTHPKYETDPRTVIMTLAGRCDLSILDDKHHPVWGTIDARPKHFIKRLLMLQEEDRMTAAEALLHPWFSSYAEDFEEQYARSIQDWAPRKHNLELVERIPNSIPNLSKMSRPNRSSDEESTAEFFKSPEQRPTQDANSIAVNPRWRANTPLPSIWEDYEAGQFASQGKAPPALRKAQPDRWNPCMPEREYDEQPYHPNSVNKRGGDHSRLARLSRNRSAKTATSELPKHAAAKDRDRNYVAGDSDVDQSLESPSIVSNNYIQTGNGKEIMQLQTSGTHVSVQVDETPLAEQVLLENDSHDAQDNDEDNSQALFVLKWQQKIPVEAEPDSILVHETPPDSSRKYRSTVRDDPCIHRNYYPYSVGHGRNTVHPEHTKRRRLSRTCA